MQIQYPALVEPLIAITPYNNPQAYYPDFLDTRKQVVEDYYVEPLVPIANAVVPFVAAYFPDFLNIRAIAVEGENYREVLAWQEFDGLIFPIYQDFLDSKGQLDLSSIAAPVFVPTVGPLTLKNWDVEYPEFLVRGRDDSYFPSFFELLRPLPVPGAATNLSLIEYYNLTVRLDVKKAIDSGTVVAISTDVTGTPVNFNKAFKDVDSVTATVQETTGFIVVVDFVDVPNPTGFSVYVYDRATGARATKTVYWAARGII